MRSEVVDREEKRRKAITQFKDALTEELIKKLDLLPVGHNEVVHQYESQYRYRGHDVGPYTLTIFLRNKKGQYIMFKSTTTKPYIKFTEPNVAKTILKDKFIESL